jgi:DNA-binding IclR family transcriptional regulator
MGAVFVAWADAGTVDRWLTQVAANSGPRSMQRYQRALALVRTRGFALGMGGHSRERIAEALSELMAGATNRRLRTTVQDLLRELDVEEEQYILTEIDEQESYDVAMISAPVFDAEGHVVIALTLMGLGMLTGGQIDWRGERLLRATRAITLAINGHAPAPIAEAAPLPQPAAEPRRRRSPAATPSSAN